MIPKASGKMAPPTPWIVRARIMTRQRRRERGEQRAAGEPGEHDDERPLLPEHVAEAARDRRRDRGGEEVRREDPRNAGGGGVELVLERGRAGHDERLQHRVAAAAEREDREHEAGARRQRVTGPPPPSRAPYHKRMAPSAYGTAGERPLRRDARENRDRILAAAREAFAELGMDGERGGDRRPGRRRRRHALPALPDEGRARRSGLRGASRTRRGGRRAALEAADAWEGLLGYLTHVVGLQAADRGLSEIMGAALRSEQVLGRARTRLRPLVEELIARAQATGDLRGDVTYEDVSVLLWTTGGSSTRRETSRPSSGGATSRSSWTGSGRAARRRFRSRR